MGCREEILLTGFGDDLLVEAFSEGADIAEAEVGCVCAGVEEFAAEVALGLEGAEFGGAFVEQAVRKGTRAINGELDFGGRVALRGILVGEIFFHLAATAEAQDCSADFTDEIVFEHS